METELKKDKFRNAILLALEERRMSELEKIDTGLVRKDAEHLYRALTAKEGGESAMINIIVVRSDKHLVEVLKAFETQKEYRLQNNLPSHPIDVSFATNSAKMGNISGIGLGIDRLLKIINQQTSCLFTDSP